MAASAGRRGRVQGSELKDARAPNVHSDATADRDSESDIDIDDLVSRSVRLMSEGLQNTSVDPGDEVLLLEPKAANAGESRVAADAREPDGKIEDRKSKKKPTVELACSLEVAADLTKSLYLVTEPANGAEASRRMAESSKNRELLKHSVVTKGFEKQYCIPAAEESKRRLLKQRQIERSKTKGAGWFDMPATELSEERKNDLVVLQMRRVLDPKRFYKGNDMKALPKYFQMGKVVEGPADFYNSRIPKKERKATIVDELLADSEFRSYNKRKYVEINASKLRGRGAYKHAKRLKKRK